MTTIYNRGVYVLWKQKNENTIGWSVEDNAKKAKQRKVFSQEIIGEEMPERFKDLEHMEMAYRLI